MDFLTSLIRPRAGAVEDAIQSYIVNGPSGSLSLAGVAVTAETALKISAVWACVRLISQSLASIPLLVYQRQADDGRQRAGNHPLYGLLHDQPNRNQTAFEFKRLLTLWALLRGAGRARIVPGPRGPVDRLIPIHPDQVLEVDLVDDDRKRYRLAGGPGQKDTILLDDEIFEVAGMSWDGVNPLSVVGCARQSMGLAIATESHGARVFSQGATLGGVLSYPGRLDPKKAEAIRADWTAQHAGLDNAHAVAVFGDGITWKETTMNMEDAQFLATREFQVADIARWFGVDLTLIQENSKSTSWGTGIEQLLQAFVTFTLLPWARAWEEAIARDLIIAPQAYFAEYQLNSLVRGDLKTRYESYEIAIRAGIKNRNEIRRLENDNAVPGLDGYDKPLNMGDATQPGGLAVPAPAGGAHYRKLLDEAAGRVVRKEMLALSKAAKRAGEDPAQWAQLVNEFYGDHSGFVAQALAMPAPRAELYCTANQLTLLERGPDAVTAWLPERAEHLVQMATEGDDV